MQALASMGKGALAATGVAYFAAVNAIGVGMFWYDKQQALRHGWRVPEATLQLSALAGGWLGGMWAMDKFRHKTKKEPFRTIYFGAVAGNVVLVGGVGYYLSTSGKLDVQQLMNSPLGSKVMDQVKKQAKNVRF